MRKLIAALLVLVCSATAHGQFFERHWSEYQCKISQASYYPGQGACLWNKYVWSCAANGEQFVRVSPTGDTLFTIPLPILPWPQNDTNAISSTTGGATLMLPNGYSVISHVVNGYATTLEYLYRIHLVDAAGNVVFTDSVVVNDFSGAIGEDPLLALDGTNGFYFCTPHDPGNINQFSVKIRKYNLSGTLLSDHVKLYAGAGISNAAALQSLFVMPDGNLALKMHYYQYVNSDPSAHEHIWIYDAGMNEVAHLQPAYTAATAYQVANGVEAAASASLIFNDPSGGFIALVNLDDTTGASGNLGRWIYRFTSDGQPTDSAWLNAGPDKFYAGAVLPNGKIVTVAGHTGAATTFNNPADPMQCMVFDSSLDFLYSEPGGMLGQDYAGSIQLLPNEFNGVFFHRGGATYDICTANTDSLFMAYPGQVSGEIYLDEDANCTNSAGDNAQANAKAIFTAGSEVWYAFTSAAGAYQTGLPYSSYAATHAPNHYNKVPACITTVPVNLSLSAPSATIDFADTGVSSLTDLQVNILPAAIGLWGASLLPVQVRNMGGAVTSGTLTVSLDTLVSYGWTNVPGATVSGTEVTIPIGPLQVDSVMDVKVFVYLDTAASNMDTMRFTASLLLSGDADPTDNADTLWNHPLLSFDPNDKSVDRPLHIHPGQDVLTYRIRYQNCGTAAARNVRILDTIDARLDVASIEVLAAAPAWPQLSWRPGNELSFWMPDIWLPDSNTNEPASHGEVVYAIRLKPTAQLGDTIRNTAGIYFDYNAPVVTNTTVNVLTEWPQSPTSVAGVADVAAVSIAPNPNDGLLYCTLPDGQWTASLADMTGRSLRGWKVKGGTASQALRLGVPPGMYLIRFTNATGQSAVKKVVVR